VHQGQHRTENCSHAQTCLQGRAHVASLILRGAVLLALPLGAFCVAVPLKFSSFITADSAVAASLAKLAPLASMSILLCTIDVACEGLLVASHRMRLLITSMTVVLAFVVVYFVAGGGASLAGTWAGLVIFFGPRCCVSVTAVLGAMMKARRQAAQALLPEVGVERASFAAAAA
jgi:Na+-driven multidrug efflux pump